MAGKQQRRLGGKCGMTGKRRFGSYQGALNRAMEICETPACNAEVWRVYQCEFCGGWHLTSKAAKEMAGEQQ